MRIEEQEFMGKVFKKKSPWELSINFIAIKNY